jgi:hypothetical protein
MNHGAPIEVSNQPLWARFYLRFSNWLAAEPTPRPDVQKFNQQVANMAKPSIWHRLGIRGGSVNHRAMVAESIANMEKQIGGELPWQYAARQFNEFPNLDHEVELSVFIRRLLGVAVCGVIGALELPGALCSGLFVALHVTTIVAPLFEELLKHKTVWIVDWRLQVCDTSPTYKMIISGIMATLESCGNTNTSFGGWAGQFVLHGAMSLMPLWPAVAFHSCHNLGVACYLARMSLSNVHSASMHWVGLIGIAALVLARAAVSTMPKVTKYFQQFVTDMPWFGTVPKPYWRMQDMPCYANAVAVLPPAPDVTAMSKVNKCDTRRLFSWYPVKVTADTHCYGFGNKHYRGFSYAPCAHNELAALYGRVLAPQLPVAQNDMRDFVQWLHSNLSDMTPNCLREPIVAWSRSKYILRSGAAPGVKRKLREACLRLDALGYTESELPLALPADYLHKITRRSAFVKREINLHSTSAGVKIKPPRLIQGSEPEFVMLVGPWVAAFQERLKSDMCIATGSVLASGVRSADLANFVMEWGPDVTFGNDDFGFFDMSIHEDIIAFEAEQAKRYGAPPVVVQILASETEKHGTTSKGIKYRVSGQRPSGHPNTTVSNGFLNWGGHAYALAVANGNQGGPLRYKDLIGRFKMLLAGDDNLLVINRSLIIPDFNAIFAKLGLRAEFVICRTVWDIEFCSNWLYHVEEGYVFGPKPGRLLCKMGYFVDPPPLKRASRKQLVRGSALGLLPACAHLAPVMVVLNRLLQLTSGVKAASYGAEEEWKMSYVSQTRSSRTDDTLAHLYGYNETMLRDFETYVNTLQLGDEMDHPLIHLFCSVDSGGPRC